MVINIKVEIDFFDWPMFDAQFNATFNLVKGGTLGDNNHKKAIFKIKCSKMN
jgi:hypothetical protein